MLAQNEGRLKSLGLEGVQGGRTEQSTRFIQEEDTEYGGSVDKWFRQSVALAQTAWVSTLASLHLFPSATPPP